MKTTTAVKLDKDIKYKAQRLAREFGLPLSTVINAQLKQFVRDREIVLSEIPRMSTYLEKLIEEIQDDLENGKNMSPVLSTPKDIDKYFASL